MRTEEQLALFENVRGFERVAAGSEIRGMVRARTSGTSVTAARAVRGVRSALQVKVLAILGRGGPMTAEELENHEEMVALNLAPSTVRKRISELFQAGELVEAGERPNRRGSAMLTVWVVNHGSARMVTEEAGR